MGLIGRDDFLMERLCQRAEDGIKTHGRISERRKTDRGYEFDVQVCETTFPYAETGHIARVSIALESYETQN